MNIIAEIYDMCSTMSGEPGEEAKRIATEKCLPKQFLMQEKLKEFVRRYKTKELLQFYSTSAD